MYGTIYKLFNVKWAYLAAVFIFEVGSLVTAVAPTSTAFIVGRAIAGVSRPASSPPQDATIHGLAADRIRSAPLVSFPVPS